MFGIAQSLEVCSNLELAFYSVIFVLSVTLIEWILKKMVGKFWDEKISYKTYCGLRWSLTIFMVLMLVLLWFERIKSLFLFMGLVIIGISILVKEAVFNWICSIYIKNKKPFQIGDRIQIGDICGDVIGTTGFSFDVFEQNTGAINHIPNSKISKLPLKNFTKTCGYEWSEIELELPFGVDLADIKGKVYTIVNGIDLLKGTSTKVQKNLAELHSIVKMAYNNCSPTIYTRIQKDKVILTVRYLVQPRKSVYVRSMIYSQLYELYNDKEIMNDKDDDKLL